MSRQRWVPVVAVILLTACFHQVVQTGRTPGPTVVEKEWVSSWIFGLVPAEPIDVRRQCPSGVATVETQQSFPNALVGAVTFGIYTPQSVKVTCATGGGSPLPNDALEVRIPANATRAEGVDLVDTAIATSIRTHKTVVLRF
jgi:Bor protein